MHLCRRNEFLALEVVKCIRPSKESKTSFGTFLESITNKLAFKLNISTMQHPLLSEGPLKVTKTV